MKFSYKLSNVLGSVYHKGNLLFTPDGANLLSPVGNKVVVYDLKSSTSRVIPFEVEYNLNHVALNPIGSILLAATERTQLYMCSMISGTVLHRKDFKNLGQISGIGFSPNGLYYVVCGGNKALVYITPGIAISGKGREMSPFKIHRVVKAHYDEITCFSWSSDSRLLAIGSKDLSVKIVCVDKSTNKYPRLINLSGHSSAVSQCFFNGVDLYTLSSNGQLFVWEANYTQKELEQDEFEEPPNFSRRKRMFLTESVKGATSSLKLTSADYHHGGKLLVVGFSNGSFLLYETTDLTLIHSLELSTYGEIDSVRFNKTGDWIGIASGFSPSNLRPKDDPISSKTQLVVWEWQSETFILKQSGTGAGVSTLTECISYSPDCSTIASGDTTGNIKLWNTFSNFCFATFSEEHKGPVTCLEFVPNKGGKVLLSASLDGTVRAFDMNRYRNFRVLTSPSDAKPAQFISLAVDSLGGDFVAAGSQNLFEIFLWSLTTGRLLECLTGHDGPVSGVKFSPTTNTLVSCSWDGTARIWDLFEGSKCTREVVTIGSDALCLAISPDGVNFAVSTITGNISFFNTLSGEETGVSIEGKKDLETTQSTSKLAKDRDKFFTSLHYSMDGQYIIGGGKSKHICLYNVSEKILVKKFAVTWNLSMDGMYDYISSRKIAEFGFNTEVFSQREDSTSSTINLPGVAKGDFSSRMVSPMIAVLDIKFSPTMRSFVATTTEGIHLYSLEQMNMFDPFQLEENINDGSVRKALAANEFNSALMQSLKLNELAIVNEVLESIPLQEIAFVSASLPVKYIEILLRHIAHSLDASTHLEFYLSWTHTILEQHGVTLKNTQSSAHPIHAVLRQVQRNLTKHFDNLGKQCDYNKYFLKFIQQSKTNESASLAEEEME